MNHTHRWISLIIALALLCSTLAAVVWAADGSISMTAFWTANNSNELTLDFAGTATARLAVTSGSTFNYRIQAQNLVTGDIFYSETSDPISSNTGQPPHVYFLDVPADIPIPVDDTGDYRIRITVWNVLGGSVERELLLHVRGNHAPVISIPSLTFTLGEDDLLTFQVTATDQDNENLTLVISTGQPSGSSFSRVIENIPGRIIKEFSWRPSFTQAGAYDVRFRAADGELIDGETVQIIVTDNTAPSRPVVMDEDGSSVSSASVDEGNSLILQAQSTDAEADTITYEVYRKVCRFFVCMELQVGSSTFDQATGTLTFTPDFTYVQHSDTIKKITVYFRASDGDQKSAERSVVITVNDINRLPTADNQTVTLPEDSFIDLILTGTDVDEEDVEEGLIFLGTFPSHGVLSGAAPDVRYTPSANYVGPDSFTFTVTDQMGGVSAAGTVIITVNSVNDLPTLSIPDQAIPEDAGTLLLNLGTYAGDVEDADSALTFAVITETNTAVIDCGINAGGTSVECQTQPNQSGTSTVTVSVTDRNGGIATDTFTVTVTPLNDAPTAANDSFFTPEDTVLRMNVLANDGDVDGDALTVVAFVTRPSRGTVATDPMTNEVIYTPQANDTGTYSFIYRISDSSGAMAQATITVIVTPVNDAPAITRQTPNPLVTAEDMLLAITPSLLIITDVDNPAGPFTIVVQDGLNYSVAADGFTIIPDLNYHGLLSVSVQADDGQAMNSRSMPFIVAVQVTPVNDAPVASDDAVTTDEDTAVTISVLANDRDIDGDALVISATTSPSNGTVVANADSTITYTPAANYFGNDTFIYTISDGNGGTATATVNITVNPINDAPLVANDSLVTDEDVAGSINVLTNDVDVDSALAVASVTQGSSGSVTFTSSVAVTYTPSLNFNGADSFTYTVVDGTFTRTATVDVTVNPVNDAPVASDDAYATDEDTVLTIAVPGVLGNDADVESDVLTASLVTAASNGVVTLNADGSFTYTPTLNFDGADSFTYVASDGTADSATPATVTITVNPVNDTPVANDDAVTTDEDTAVTISVLANDSDVDEDTLVISATTSPANGTVVINADSTITYTPAVNYFGNDVFTYTLSDGNGGTATATVNVTVNPINDAPVAIDDLAVTDEDTTVTIDVLANDTDVDGDTLIFSIYDGGSANGGNIDCADPSGICVYTPAQNFNYIDTFTYTITDGEFTSTATVSVAVNPVNDAPAITDQVVLTTPEETTLTITLNDLTVTDVDNIYPDEFTLTVQSGTNYAVVGNTITPGVDFNGDLTVRVIVNDGTEDSNVFDLTVVVTPVNDAPVFTSTPVVNVEEDAIYTYTATATDADDDALTFAATMLPTWLSFNDATQELSGTPTNDDVGPHAVTLTVTDETVTVEQSFTITVGNVNDAPTTADSAVTTDEDTPYFFLESDFTYNDVDGGPDELMIIQSVPDQGTFQIDDGTNIKIINVGNMLDRAEWSMLFFTPAADEIGSPYTSFTFVVSDGIMGSISDPATMTINVVPLNDAPVASDDIAVTDEDITVTVSVLANDGDIDGATLTVSAITSPTNGTVVINADSTITYTPAVNYFGNDAFTYTLSDGNGGTATATVDVTVNPINDAPVASDDNYVVAEDGILIVPAAGILMNDTDVDTGSVLTALLLSSTSNGTLTFNADGSFRYLPNADYNGPDSFTYQATDGTSASNIAIVAIMVSTANDAPVAVDDAYVTDEDVPLAVPAISGVVANDFDEEGNIPFTAIMEDNADNGTVILNADSSFIYTPNANFNGTDGFTYRVMDSGAPIGTSRNVGTVTITVNPVNDAPVASDDAYVTDEDTALTIAAPGVLGNDTDVESNALTVVVFSSPAQGVLSPNADGSFIYTPAVNFTGTDSFTYIVNDGIVDSTPVIVTITVNPINDAPVAIDDIAVTDEDTAVTISVLANDGDVDGDTLVISATTSPANGTIVANADNTITYTPAMDFVGNDAFTYTISDGNGGTATATVNVTVNPANDAPVANDDLVATDEDTAVTISVFANDSDVDEDTLVISATTSPANGTVVANADNTITYTPTLNFVGNDAFTYTISDGNGGTATATVNVTVNAVNDAPLLTDDSLVTDEDAAGSINVLMNDLDVDNALAVASVTQGSSGSVVFTSPGAVTYTPITNFNGADSFTYTVVDGSFTETATVSVTVNAVNDAPVANDDAYVTDEDTSLVIAAPGVLGNDTDVENNILTVLVISMPTQGTLMLSADGSFTYTPTLNFLGDDSFTYVVNDGTADSSAPGTVTITVNSLNDTPFTIDDLAVTDEDVAVTISVLANDRDIDGDALAVSATTTPTNGTVVVNAGNTVTYTPTLNFVGDDAFTYTISDGNGGTATATVNVTVNPVNDAPTVANDAYTLEEDILLTIASPGVLGNDNDLETPVVLTAHLVTGVASGILALDPSGSFTYTPAANFAGTDSFTYVANDGIADSAVATVTLTVTAINDAPLLNIPDRTISEDAAPQLLELRGFVADDDPLTDLSFTLDTQTNPAVVSCVLQADGHTLECTPRADQIGSSMITITVTDSDGLSATDTFTIRVIEENDAPAFISTPITSATEDVLYTYLAEAADVEGNALRFTASILPSWLTLADRGDGTAVLSGTPDDAQVGTHTVTLIISDGTLTAEQSFIITVADVHDAPIALNQSLTTAEETPLAFTLQATAGDAPIVRYVIEDLPNNGLLSGTAPNLVYTPQGDFVGVDSFIYRAVDSANASSTLATVTITVTNINDTPLIISRPITEAIVGEHYTYPVQVRDEGPLTFTLAQAPEGMTISGTGIVQWLPEEEGDVSVTIIVSDGIAQAMQQYTIVVKKVLEQQLQITSVHLGNELPAPGELMSITVNLENEGRKDLRKLQVNVTLLESAIRESSSTFRLKKNHSATQRLNLALPDDLPPGEYLLKIAAGNDSFRDTAYRQITVTQK